jgi:hypothetical protein
VGVRGNKTPKIKVFWGTIPSKTPEIAPDTAIFQITSEFNGIIRRFPISESSTGEFQEKFYIHIVGQMQEGQV